MHRTGKHLLTAGELWHIHQVLRNHHSHDKAFLRSIGRAMDSPNLQGRQTTHVRVERPEICLFDDDIPAFVFHSVAFFKKEMVASNMVGWHMNTDDCIFARW